MPFLSTDAGFVNDANGRHYDYRASEDYCKQIGLHWLGNDFAGLVAMDEDAKRFGLTQEQVDAGMRHHLWQVHWLFCPKNYSWYQRIILALYFLTGIGAK